jgi:hypothetical protein
MRWRTARTLAALLALLHLATLAAGGSAVGRAPRVFQRAGDCLEAAQGGVRRIGQVSINALKRVGGAFRLAFLNRMAEHSGLSGRGVVSMTPVRDDLEEFFTAWSNPFEPNTNPGKNSEKVINILGICAKFNMY